MQRRNLWSAIASWSAIAVLALACGGRAAAAVPDDQSNDADLAPCGLSAGTLTTVLTPDNSTDFVVFGLYDGAGNEVAEQFIPLYNPNASAELMITPIGFGGAIASAKCLADSSVRRCSDPNWALTEGLAVSLAGLVVGPDFVIAAIDGRYKRPSNTAQLAIDGGMAGFQVDKQPIVWSAFYNSEPQVSQAFFGLRGGAHTLTIGSRDPDNSELVPQERLCFRV